MASGRSPVRGGQPASADDALGVLVGIDAGGLVYGWAGSLTDPAPSALEIHVDGTLVGSTVAELAHRELDQLTAGGARCAFVFALPATFLDGAEHVVDVRFAATAQSLDASPVSFAAVPGARSLAGPTYAGPVADLPPQTRPVASPLLRKGRKFMAQPQRFLGDSQNPGLRALGRVIARFGPRRSAELSASLSDLDGAGEHRNSVRDQFFSTLSRNIAMSRGNNFRRKIAKFRKAPGRFLTDSNNRALRAIGALVTEVMGESTRRSSWKVPNAREVIEASGLFDAVYYTERYSDVRKSGSEPLDHYVRNGARERRAPNWLFDPSYYARQAGIEVTDDPLLHYILIGEREGIATHRRFNPASYRALYPDVAQSSMGALEHFLKVGRQLGRQAVHAPVPNPGDVSTDKDLRTLDITILVPVYNGGRVVRDCVESVLTHTHLPGAKLLLIDDASSDPETRALLDQYGKLSRVTLLRNETNLGFTRTVNRGLQHAQGDDVVLLNSDTVVSPRWLEYLAIAAYGAPNIATATALSDSAGAFSTPKSGPNDTLAYYAVQEAARLSARAAPCDVHFVPTGNGFCMYMRRNAIEATGLLDDVNFPRGYGEENDWCMRAGKRGFAHVIALRAYVHHVNAVSFGSEAKERLRRDARAVLDRLHPDYGAQVSRAFSGDTPLQAHRRAFQVALETRRDPDLPPRPRVLFVVSTRTGGTPQTNEDLMRGLSAVCEPLLLTCDHAELQLNEFRRGRAHELAWHSLSEPITFVPHTSGEYDAVIARWLTTFDVELVHVRHIAWHGLGLPAVAKRLNIPVVFSLHDFYTVCPSVNLTNGKDSWCSTGVTRPHIISPLWSERDAQGVEAIQKADPDAFLELWKSRMNAMLAECDAYVTTSPFAKEVMCSNLPVLAERTKDFLVIPHGRDFDHFLAPARAPRARESLRVLIAGNIGEAKGLHTILQIIALDKRGDLEFHLIGNARAALLDCPRVNNHGSYQRKDFSKLVAKIQPHVSLIISIWPETFCHTLTESWAAGLPVVGADLGAVGERIRASGIGWAVDPLNASQIYELLQRIRRGEEDWGEHVAALTRWRQSTADHDVAAMSSEYFDLYSRLWRQNRPMLPAEGRRKLGLQKRVAVLARGHFPQSMSTVHVRMATPLSQASGEVSYEWLDAGEFLRNGPRDFDGAIVCRNAGAPGVLQEVARVCKRDGVPLVLDLDDDLFNAPAVKDRSNVYRAFAPALRDLLDMATVTTVSTEELAKQYGTMTRAVRVVPNKLNPELWLGADPPRLPPPAEVIPGGEVRLLYMGSATHGDDLQLVLRAVERLREEYDVRLYVMGITNDPPPSVIKIVPPDTRYDQFVGWFRAVAGHFHVALAPLEGTDFNSKKSALKFMDYAAAGLPVVASRVPPYSEIVRDGVDGVLAENDAESWYGAMRALVADAALRTRLGAAAKARAHAEFGAQSCVFDELFAGRAPAAVRNVEHGLSSSTQAGAAD